MTIRRFPDTQASSDFFGSCSNHEDGQIPWFKGEQSTMEFRWEPFNTFNHTQWKDF